MMVLTVTSFTYEFTATDTVIRKDNNNLLLYIQIYT